MSTHTSVLNLNQVANESREERVVRKFLQEFIIEIYYKI